MFPIALILVIVSIVPKILSNKMVPKMWYKYLSHNPKIRSPLLPKCGIDLHTEHVSILPTVLMYLQLRFSIILQNIRIIKFAFSMNPKDRIKMQWRLWENECKPRSPAFGRGDWITNYSWRHFLLQFLLEMNGIRHERGSVCILSFQMLPDLGIGWLGEPMVRITPGESVRRSKEGLFLGSWRRS